MRLFLLRGVHHLETLRDGVRHGLFAVDVFARIASIDHHAHVPMIGHSGDNAIDVLAIQQIVIVALTGRLALPVISRASVWRPS